MTQSNDKDDKAKRITISIDGEDFEVEDRSQTPRELLTLASLDPEISFLIELRGQQQVSLRDMLDEPIKLHSRMRFISADIGSAPMA